MKTPINTAISLIKERNKFLQDLHFEADLEDKKFIYPRIEENNRTIKILNDLKQSEEEMFKEINRLQEKYDENGFDCSSLIKLKRIEGIIDSLLPNEKESKLTKEEILRKIFPEQESGFDYGSLDKLTKSCILKSMDDYFKANFKR